MMIHFWIKLFALLLVLVGALNWGLIGALRFNLVTYVTNLLGVPTLTPYIYMTVGFAALVHIFRRDFYLPFLGKTVYPCGSLVPKRPWGADTTATIKTQPNANVIYWAAEPNSEVVDNPWLAYDQYANSGVARSNDAGYATLSVRRPAPYKLPAFKAGFKKQLSPHIHYRVCKKPGMLGPVESVKV